MTIFVNTYVSIKHMFQTLLTDLAGKQELNFIDRSSITSYTYIVADSLPTINYCTA